MARPVLSRRAELGGCRPGSGRRGCARGPRPSRGGLPEARSGADQWQRIVLNRSVDAYLDALGIPVPDRGRDQRHRARRQAVASLRSLDYPAFDLCAPLALDGALRRGHLRAGARARPRPVAAARNLRGLCEPGGLVVVSTPFLDPGPRAAGLRDARLLAVHARGSAGAARRAGLEVESVQSWGNRSCVIGNFDRWPAYRRWHSLRNEPDLPLQVWAFARNPSRP